MGVDKLPVGINFPMEDVDLVSERDQLCDMEAEKGVSPWLAIAGLRCCDFRAVAGFGKISERLATGSVNKLAQAGIIFGQAIWENTYVRRLGLGLLTPGTDHNGTCEGLHVLSEDGCAAPVKTRGNQILDDGRGLHEICGERDTPRLRLGRCRTRRTLSNKSEDKVTDFNVRTPERFVVSVRFTSNSRGSFVDRSV